MHPPRIPALALLAGLPAIALLTSSPGTALATLTGIASPPSLGGEVGGTARAGAPGAHGSTSSGAFDPTGSWDGDPTAPLLAVVALAAWGCALWLTLVVLVTYLGRLPGTPGHAGRLLSRLLAPASVRTFVRVATGLTVAGTVLAGPSAQATPPPTPIAAVTGGQDLSLDWPGTAPTPAPLEVASTSAGPTSAGRTSAGRTSAGPTSAGRTSAGPTSAEPADQDLTGTRRDPGSAIPGAPSAARGAPSGVPESGAVVVRPGDSLWAIASDALGPQATEALVARAWPQWWGANRAVIGEDPDLIRPGTALVRPPLGDPHR